MKILGIVLLLMITLSAPAKTFQLKKKHPKIPVERIEPLSWWVGMKNPELQIMVYGPQIATYRPEIHYPGVKIERVVTTTNPNYLFIYLYIDKTALAGKMKIEFWKGDKEVFSYPYLLQNRQEGSEERGIFECRCGLFIDARSVCKWKSGK